MQNLVLKPVLLLERSTEGPAAQNVESTVATVAEQTAQPEDQNDAWKKLKDIAGSLANGAFKLLKDNLSSMGLLGGPVSP